MIVFNANDIIIAFAIICFTSCAICSCESKQEKRSVDWPSYGGNSAGNRFSNLTQINKKNVTKLELAWAYETGENTDSGSRGIDMQCQPIVVNGVLYAVTPRMKLFALDAATGKEKWKFDPFADSAIKVRIHPVRGVVYWEKGKDKRIFYTVGSSIFAIDALSGKKISRFGQNGIVDLHLGLRDNEVFGADPEKFSIRNTSPGAIYKDLLIMGSSVSEGPDAPPGYIQAFDVYSGKMVWIFHTVPLPGEYGFETWSPDSYKKLGGANCWSGITIDEKRGIAYVSTGSPSVDFYGAARNGKNLFANCILALEAGTGKRLWHFQTIHHDLWDRDLPTAPNLVTVDHGGKMIDAVAQPTKDGLLFVLDRTTGQPLFPVEEVAVPVTPALPGEHPWPTQPVPLKPAPFSTQELTKENITVRTPEANEFVLNRYMNSRYGSKYMPPNTDGTLYFGFGGGAEWGGTAVDQKGIIYINANNMLWWLQMRQANTQASEQSMRGHILYNANCAGCHGLNDNNNLITDKTQGNADLTEIGNRLSMQQISTIIETGNGRMPSFQHLSKQDRETIIDFLLHGSKKNGRQDTVKTGDITSYPYSPLYLNNGTTQFRDNNGYPAIKPPWGTLSAIDLNSGDYVWQVPLGYYPELKKSGMTETGTENHGGPLATATGLLFIAATYDEHLRAFDTGTGKILWQYKLPAGGFATPISYMVRGRQYIVIASGGTRYGLKSGGSYVAMALPE